MISQCLKLLIIYHFHFIQQFKEVVGMTPKKYRDTHHDVKWNEKIGPESDKANHSSEAM